MEGERQMGNDVLPIGWSRALLGEICNRIDAVDPSDEPNKSFTYVDIASIDNRANRIATPKRLLGKDAPSRARQKIRTGDTLFSTVRTYLKNIAIVPPDLDGQVCSTGFCVIRPIEQINPKYVFYYVLTNKFINDVTPTQTGILYPATKDSTILEQTIPIPPTAEQERIVSRIDDFRQELGTAKRSLLEAQSAMDTFHHAVLARAYDGGLVHQDPTDEAAVRILESINRERKTPWEAPAIKKSHCLPKGWEWTSIGSIVESTFYGPRFAKGEYETTGTFTIRTTDMDDRGNVLLRNPPRIKLSQEQLNAFGLQKGDILITRSGSIGKCAIFENVSQPAIPSAYLIRMRLFIKHVSPQYVLYYLLSPAGQELLGTGSHAITQQNINAETIKKFPIPLAPAKEQFRIADEIRALLDAAGSIEGIMRTETDRVEELEQAIITKAFRGELIPQDPNDEPASVLLERIKIEETKQSSGGKRRHRLSTD